MINKINGELINIYHAPSQEELDDFIRRTKEFNQNTTNQYRKNLEAKRAQLKASTVQEPKTTKIVKIGKNEINDAYEDLMQEKDEAISAMESIAKESAINDMDNLSEKDKELFRKQIEKAILDANREADSKIKKFYSSAIDEINSTQDLFEQKEALRAEIQAITSDNLYNKIIEIEEEAASFISSEEPDDDTIETTDETTDLKPANNTQATDEIIDKPAKNTEIVEEVQTAEKIKSKRIKTVSTKQAIPLEQQEENKRLAKKLYAMCNYVEQVETKSNKGLHNVLRKIVEDNQQVLNCETPNEDAWQIVTCMMVNAIIHRQEEIIKELNQKYQNDPKHQKEVQGFASKIQEITSNKEAMDNLSQGILSITLYKNLKALNGDVQKFLNSTADSSQEKLEKFVNDLNSKTSTPQGFSDLVSSKAPKEDTFTRWERLRGLINTLASQEDENL